MEPIYMSENRYSYMVASWRPSANADYETKSPESSFEKHVQALYLEGQTHLQHEEFMLALQAFRELMALILHTADPKMPVDPNKFPGLRFPVDIALIDTLAQKAGDILTKTPVIKYTFPSSLISDQSILPASATKKIKLDAETGIQFTSHFTFVDEALTAAFSAIEEKNFDLAVRHYTSALEKTPNSDAVLRASLMHDMAILFEKVNNKVQAEKMGKQSVDLFTRAKSTEGHVHALDTFSGILRRAGKTAEADAQAKKAAQIRNTFNLNPVVATHTTFSTRSVSAVEPAAPVGGVRAARGFLRPGFPPISVIDVGRVEAGGVREIPSTPEAPVLMAMKYVPQSDVTKSYNIQGVAETTTIILNADASANVKNFLQTVADTQNLELVTNFWISPSQVIAYLPHMYFFIIPMAIGDCLAGMGNLLQAEEQYRSVLPYAFINKKFEIVKVWTRLAQVYLDLGDEAYRRAKDNTAAYTEARKAYENLVLLNKTPKPNSPLYQDAKFSAIKTRVTNFLAAADPVTFDENPAITSPVLEALTKLQQIEAGLNFFGFAPNYVPPFSFEYLQNSARYFAQQASQIEQRYIQFKSTAENEELRREQLDQQAEVARQTVVLEQRGVAEAQAGINVAQAGLNYAEVQRQNAVAARDDFNAVRWELLELAMLEAWGTATSVHTDDQIKFNIDWTYYQSSKKPRNQVLMDLAGQRTRISHDLEAKKLQRAIDSAVAYKAITQAQLAQAQARKAIAEQRVVIAQLQQRFTEENRDFLDMKEFSARLWYELAAQARRISRRYLDMATEIAFLMERAYNAETERGLNVIRYDYSSTPAGNLMGADFLAQDIDYFTFDNITTVKTKKIPMKKVLSVADEYPMAFELLRTKGGCVFQTELEQFDRENPGVYLCKIRNVELLLVGITGATNFAGALRNIGVSRFRREDGSVVSRLYPADVMPLSQYSIRQDALVFRFNPNDLRLFENNGIDTLWQLDMPLNANTFDFTNLIDVQLVLYYDGFFSPTLETAIKAALPTNGTASRGFSMRMWFPDELFYLKNKGDAELKIDAGMFPRNQENFKRTSVVLKVAGDAATINGLTLRLNSTVHGTELKIKTDANGEVNDLTPGQPLNVLQNEDLLDTWTINIIAADNPNLVEDGELNLGGIQDVQAFFEYSFDYRS
jgi:hypothetical protein